MKTIITFTLLLFVGTFMSAQSTWKAPKSSDAIENPLKGDVAATKKGKQMYAQLCVICHGAKGKGDGIAGATLNPKPANFTKEAFFSQTDGAIFWKLTNGNAPMAAYKDLISETERWQLVNYLRALKK
jgi:mono/diheme cytochrome c family protein